MESLLQDLRYALRTLRRSPGFALAAGLTLALAIGANTVIFSALYATLLKPLPYREPERLVRVWDAQVGVDKASASASEVLAWRQSRAVAGIAAYDRADLNLTGTDAPQRVNAARSTANLFDLLGVHPQLGRGFTEDEAQEGAPHVAVLSDAFWHRQLGGDPQVLGKSLTLNGESYTVVGVLPADFSFGENSQDADLWVPHPLKTDKPGSHYLSVLARLAPGASVKAANEDLTRLNEAFWRAQGEPIPHATLVMDWRESLTRQTRGGLLMLLGAVAFVLLIACANVANLTLVRALSRQRDGAIRAALGASRLRQVRQALAESVLLALGGGLVGLVLALWGMDLVRILTPSSMARLSPATLSVPALLYNFGLSVGCGLLFGLLPALHVTRGELTPLLKSGGAQAGALGHHPMRSALVVLQLALALVLLIGTGLTLRSVHNQATAQLGFEPEHVLTARITLPPEKYPDPARMRAFFEQVQQRVRSLPGVEQAGFVNNAPLWGSNVNGDFTIEGRQGAPGERLVTEFQIASPEYFGAMGIPLKRGRNFGPQDTDTSPGVVIVNETFAKTFFPGQEAVGQRINLGWKENEPAREIIGVVGDVRHMALKQGPVPESYVPLAQMQMNRMVLALRAKGEPTALVSSVRQEVLAVDAQQPVYDLQSYGDRLDSLLRQDRAATRLLGALAVLALVLAGVGIYGVMAYTVGQRTRELGIRRALGAQQTQVLSLVLGQGARLTLVGLGLGLAGAYLLGRVAQSILYEVSASEPAVFLGVSAGLAAVALAACWLPARRASQVDPAISLRAE
ncbi:ABC transporter permease [Aggregicoccus sp. 17bor-14]|uniref:ABC transporter permease n=1 Tax=Myxococcaceae TaxID=31 RepID=UPI00129CBD2E|nr:MULTISPECIES: ABC transporter permease [Myxococcaceae]MBF5045667.1 ABC transporter permease [Simulacricoccus sp. 17bor-14]MRI91404.1 ABC transporter permease [Aggregicoccus sp. 17bor-14]